MKNDESCYKADLCSERRSCLICTGDVYVAQDGAFLLSGQRGRTAV